MTEPDQPKRRGRPPTGQTPGHNVPMPTGRWDRLGAATVAIGLDRTKLLNQLAAWWLREPGAKPPPRPPAPPKEPAMYTATDTATREEYQFRKLNALIKRLGGDDYQVEHSEAYRPPHRFLYVLRWRPKTDSSEVVCRIQIDSDEWDAIRADEEAEETR